MHANALLMGANNGGDAGDPQDGISRLGAKGRFVITRDARNFSATFEWTSQTDVGDV
jgi:hypothetical protein